jgi:hypothetical protein
LAEDKPEDNPVEQVSDAKPETPKPPEQEPSWIPTAIVMIPDSKVQTDPIKCPSCQGLTYSLEGSYRRGFQSLIIDGKVEKEEIAGDIFIDIIGIICPKCRVKMLVVDETTYKVYEDNRDLQNQISAMTKLIISGADNKEHQC